MIWATWESTGAMSMTTWYCDALMTILSAAGTIPFCTEPTTVCSASSAGASATKLYSLTITKIQGGLESDAEPKGRPRRH